jgi:hypothetical protein
MKMDLNNMKFIFILFLMASCATRPKKSELKAAWLGKDISTLERHRYFSTLPNEKKELSDQELLINIPEHRYRATGGQTCFGSGFGWGYYSRFGLGANTCSPQQYEQDNCTHQFTIQKNKIINYVLVGDLCPLDCKYLPNSKCPKKNN